MEHFVYTMRSLNLASESKSSWWSRSPTFLFFRVTGELEVDGELVSQGMMPFFCKYAVLCQIGSKKGCYFLSWVWICTSQAKVHPGPQKRQSGYFCLLFLCHIWPWDFCPQTELHYAIFKPFFLGSFVGSFGFKFWFFFHTCGEVRGYPSIISLKEFNNDLTRPTLSEESGIIFYYISEGKNTWMKSEMYPQIYCTRKSMRSKSSLGNTMHACMLWPGLRLIWDIGKSLSPKR